VVSAPASQLVEPDQAGPAQHAEMLGDGRLAAVERGGQFGGAARLLGEQFDDAPPGGIGDRAEDILSLRQADGR
jgi:hypothetical protein